MSVPDLKVSERIIQHVEIRLELQIFASCDNKAVYKTVTQYTPTLKHNFQEIY